MEETNPRAGELIIKAIKEQIRTNEPPETKVTFDRLVCAGYSGAETYRMLGCVLVSEVYEVIRHGRTFDRDIYARRLRDLPRLPWERGSDGGAEPRE